MQNNIQFLILNGVGRLPEISPINDFGFESFTLSLTKIIWNYLYRHCFQLTLYSNLPGIEAKKYFGIKKIFIK